MDVQSEDLGCVARLDAVTLALPGVAGDDSEIGTCNGEDGAAIFRVGVELALLWLRCRDHGGHVMGCASRRGYRIQ